MIGFPLRLLAREIYDRIVAIKGRAACALITGEEKLGRRGRRATSSARSRRCRCSARSRSSPSTRSSSAPITSAATCSPTGCCTPAAARRPCSWAPTRSGRSCKRLVPEAEVISRPRFSILSFAGDSKLHRLPRRSAVVAFSAAEVYALAEVIRRQKGGAAVVLGALSPRTRNAQVAMYQAGEVEHLVATDAIGMGLNMDVAHVAFAELAKFDGREQRRLRAPEMAQIAGRAGRHMANGTLRRHQWLRAVRASARSRRSRATASRRSRRCAGATASSTSPSVEALSASLDRRRRRWTAWSRCATRSTTAAWSSCRGATRSGRAADQRGAGAPAVAGLPDPGLPQDPDRRAPAPAGHGLPAPHRPARRAAERLGRRHDRPARADSTATSTRWSAGSPMSAPGPTCRTARLADGCRALAGARARGRGPAVRCAARAADPAVRRPPHLGADALPARQATSTRPWSTPTGEVVVDGHLVGRIEGLNLTIVEAGAGCRPAAADGRGPARGVARAASPRGELVAAPDDALDARRRRLPALAGCDRGPAAPRCDACSRPGSSWSCDADPRRRGPGPASGAGWSAGSTAGSASVSAPSPACARPRARPGLAGAGRGIAFRLVEQLGAMRRDEADSLVPRPGAAPTAGRWPGSASASGGIHLFVPDLLKPAASEARGAAAAHLPRPPGRRCRRRAARCCGRRLPVRARPRWQSGFAAVRRLRRSGSTSSSGSRPGCARGPAAAATFERAAGAGGRGRADPGGARRAGGGAGLPAAAAEAGVVGLHAAGQRRRPRRAPRRARRAASAGPADSPFAVLAGLKAGAVSESAGAAARQMAVARALHPQPRAWRTAWWRRAACA